MNQAARTLLGIGRKQLAVVRIAFRQQWAYKADFVLRSSFLLLILYVLGQLYGAAYAGDYHLAIGGFTLRQIVWYLVFTEAITLAGPPVGVRIEEEVKNGDIAVRLTRPLSYVGYHYGAYVGEGALRFFVLLAAGALVAWLSVGPLAPGYGLFAYLPLALLGLTLSFLMTAAVGLCAFWVEETRGLEFVLQKLTFTAGGLLIPIDLMPEWLQRVCAWLPFQAALYLPARLGVRFDSQELLRACSLQLAWIAALALLVAFIFRRGVSKLHVNGG
ncbi:ABC transporter permease [Cohnella hashimotonis]|uniref:ABC-2 family transporter protein n=1 Tax=Cohnella hashimotonis TaxID=2826895 RepID=A0ABT6TI90_9BACL|nr:ABC-2 family transporter protein [Cohnella hashimotonis]MDI4646526.1 ABC-2 family transporter protein [Cohnella hashimotonis]